MEKNRSSLEYGLAEMSVSSEKPVANAYEVKPDTESTVVDAYDVKPDTESAVVNAYDVKPDTENTVVDAYDVKPDTESAVVDAYDVEPDITPKIFAITLIIATVFGLFGVWSVAEVLTVSDAVAESRGYYETVGYIVPSDVGITRGGVQVFSGALMALFGFSIDIVGMFIIIFRAISRAVLAVLSFLKK